MKELTKKQKIANIKKAFTERNDGKGYMHSFIDNKTGDFNEEPFYTQNNDYATVSYYEHSFRNKKELRIFAGKTETKRTSNNRVITKTEPLEWYLNTQDAENLICFLEAFIEIENQKGDK